MSVVLRESVARLRRFVQEYPTLRGLDPNVVYTIHVGGEPTPILLSDLRNVLAAVSPEATP